MNIFNTWHWSKIKLDYSQLNIPTAPVSDSVAGGEHVGTCLVSKKQLTKHVAMCMDKLLLKGKNDLLYYCLLEIVLVLFKETPFLLLK